MNNDELKELHGRVMARLGISPDFSLWLMSNGKSENVTFKFSRMIFTAIAKHLGASSLDVAEFIQREIGVVNRDVRMLNELEGKRDFISRAVRTAYLDCLTEITTI